MTKIKVTLTLAVIAAIMVTGCGQTSLKPPTPQVSVEETSPPPVPVIDNPTQQDPEETAGAGQVRGVLVNKSTQQVIPDIELCLIPKDPNTGDFGVPLMPSVITDSTGAFLFENIPVGHYNLFSMTWGHFYEDQRGNLFIFEVKPGQLTDIGQVLASPGV